jgi:hypothetical protein
MTRLHFEAITVHLVDNTSLAAPGEPGHDKIGKVRWLVEYFSAVSKELYNPEVTCTVDEIMLPYKGMFCNIRLYMKGKCEIWDQDLGVGLVLVEVCVECDCIPRRVIAVVWMDSKPVWLLSTAMNPVDPTAMAPRWVRRERVEFPTSPVLLQYQKNMRGIDVMDQCQGYYTCALESHKWWHRILTFVLDPSMHNSFVLYKEDSETLELLKHSLQLWLFTLAKQLVAPCVRPNIPRG